MSVKKYLEQVEKKLRLSEDEKESIKVSIDSIKTRLVQYFGDEISEIIVFGSYSRDTILPRAFDSKSDVDIMVVFKDFSRKPQTYIDNLKRFLKFRYYSSEIHQGSPCAILLLNHIKFELTPAVWVAGSTYKIPNNKNNYQEWMTTNPFYINNLLKEKVHSMYTRVIRLVKFWNCKNYKYFSSCELEEMVLNNFQFSILKDIKENLFAVLNNISPYGKPNYVREYIEKTQSVIAEVVKLEKEGYEVLPENEIKKIFKVE